jgi:FtsH-binding integral membrane protein
MEEALHGCRLAVLDSAYTTTGRAKMEWIVDHMWSLLAVAAAWVVGHEGKRIWGDLRPKDFRYTWSGIFVALMFAGLGFGLWWIGSIDSQEYVTVAFVSRMLSLVMLGVCASTIFLMYCITFLGKKVFAIERHLLASRNQKKDSPQDR